MNRKEFDMRKIFLILKKKKISIFLIILTAVICSAYINIAVMSPYYLVSTKIFVGKQNNEYESYNSNDIQVYEKLLKTYSEIIMTDDFIEKAMKNSNIQVNIEDVKDNLEITPLEETQILDISYVSYDKKEGEKIIVSISKELEREMKELIPNINVKVIESPKIPDKAAGPNKNLNILITLFCAIVSSICLAFFSEYIDNTVKDEGEVEEKTKIRVLGKIRKNKERQNNGTIIKRKKITGFEAEEYEIICAKINNIVKEEGVKTIIVTSVDAMDGKTIISANVALILSQMGKKVLFMECNFRKPVLRQYFKIEEEEGITDIINNKCSKEKALIKYNKNFSILLSGKKCENIFEIISGKEFDQLFNELKEEFDFIIMDSAALTPFTDSHILAGKTEGTVLIAKMYKSDMDKLCEQCENVKNIGGRVIGIILNNEDRRSMKKYEKYYFKN